jgi:hypothetical protein
LTTLAEILTASPPTLTRPTAPMASVVSGRLLFPLGVILLIWSVSVGFLAVPMQADADIQAAYGQVQGQADAQAQTTAIDGITTVTGLGSLGAIGLFAAKIIEHYRGIRKERAEDARLDRDQAARIESERRKEEARIAAEAEQREFAEEREREQQRRNHEYLMLREKNRAEAEEKLVARTAKLSVDQHAWELDLYEKLCKENAALAEKLAPPPAPPFSSDEIEVIQEKAAEEGRA